MRAILNYLDLCTEIELIELDLERVDADMDYWFGKGGIMLGSVGAHNFGSKEAIERIEHLHNKKHGILKRLEHYNEMKEDYEKTLDKLTGLDHKITVMRYVKNMRTKEIAKELNYSDGYIRNILAKCDKMMRAPLTHDVVLFK
ncbi:hypothetical protein HMPREF1210_01155 [Paenisporosarcina sp. HGH0030]|uniref:sigma factor-like helix-turn-helix DNA-binding protein n=1 Tax=Paenisporosarcina sp. HGH0030 TaxID=1078085 RepID=UPI00034E81EF|nr:sigma-70 family RNA polymerase sigma factor [Paenisporosarcina sp. HGH0030]EPD52775.1 hypothetical protein HMPREF1210_01155 [Paenisporosarcina sp. HGH0030]